jgi:hypothetical protein
MFSADVVMGLAVVFLIGFLCGAITATVIRRTDRKQLWIAAAAALLVVFFCSLAMSLHWVLGMLSVAIVLIFLLSGLLVLAIITT